MLCSWLLIDGFSLLHRAEDIAAVHRAGRLLPARHLLVDLVARGAAPLAGRTTVVFDGRGEGGPAEEFAGSPVEVLFSPSDRTADAVIERLVHDAGDPSSILVVTSDRMERDNVTASGAQTMSAGDFLDLCGQAASRTRRAAAAPGRRTPRHTLGDHFPGGPGTQT